MEINLFLYKSQCSGSWCDRVWCENVISDRFIILKFHIFFGGGWKVEGSPECLTFAGIWHVFAHYVPSVLASVHPGYLEAIVVSSSDLVLYW